MFEVIRNNEIECVITEKYMRFVKEEFEEMKIQGKIQENVEFGDLRFLYIYNKNNSISGLQILFNEKIIFELYL